jgi:hypothetical protein
MSVVPEARELSRSRLGPFVQREALNSPRPEFGGRVRGWSLGTIVPMLARAEDRVLLTEMRTDDLRCSCFRTPPKAANKVLTP